MCVVQGQPQSSEEGRRQEEEERVPYTKYSLETPTAGYIIDLSVTLTVFPSSLVTGLEEREVNPLLWCVCVLV